MNRREFVIGSAAFAGGLALTKLHAANAPLKRAAVVIGVNRVGGLPVLSAAQSGAHEVADLLQSEQFDVKLLVDDSGPVVFKTVYDTVAELVNRSTYDQLVVYFAGHGCVVAYAEFWMLSDAVANHNEAVAVLESIQMAQISGIPNVVFISDACRSTAQSLGASRIRGGVLFPEPGTPPHKASAVDAFYATAVGDPAYELPVSQSSKEFSAIYTSTLLDAFKTPDQTMIRPGPDGKPVVPNRRLKEFLEREVPKRAHAKSILIDQRPFSQVVSDDTVYIAHAASQGAPMTFMAQPTVGDVADNLLKPFGLNHQGPIVATSRVPDEAIRKLDHDWGFSDKAASVNRSNRREISPPDLDTGFVVTGTRLRTAIAGEGVKVATKFLDDRTLVQVELPYSRRAAPVALQFADGSSTIAAALHDFVGNITVDKVGVSNVSYVPGSRSDMRGMYESEHDRIAQMHAAVATAARYGVFSVDGSRGFGESQAEALASQIRVLKGIDPTLGIYAAYAYAHAGLTEKIRSVREFMHDSIGVDLFDVAMLSATPGSHRREPKEFVPLCPLLTEGWNYLRVKNVQVPELVAGGRDHLKPSLWTTFAAEWWSTVEKLFPRPSGPLPTKEDLVRSHPDNS